MPSYIGNEYFADEQDMYLIGRDLIYKNQIIASWDGYMVHEYDPNERSTFYIDTVKKDPEVKSPDVYVVAKPVEAFIESQSAASAEDILAGVYKWQVG